MKRISYKEFLPLAIIISLAASLRLFRIGDYLTFLGDEGRDVLVVKHILEGDLTLLGPRASAGDFYLGPIYYYLMAPFLWLWGLDPVGPAVMVALLGVATVLLVYYVGNKFFNYWTGIIAAFLYAISPLAIVYSRSSWNPNVMPFFTLFTMIVLYNAVVKSNWRYFLIAGFLLGIIMQLHYLGTFVALIIAIFTLIASIITKKQKWVSFVKLLFIRYISIFAGFIIGFTPFLLFELRKGFPNLQNIFKFVLHPDKTQQVSSTYSEIISDVFVRLFGRLLVNFPEPRHFEGYDSTLLLVWKYGVILFGVVSIILIVKMKNKVQMTLLLTWIIMGILAFGLYKKPIYDYYFGFLFPVPFLLAGNLFTSLYSSQRVPILSKIASAILLIIVVIPNVYFTPARYQPNRQKDQIQTISEFVLSKTDGKPFNFALIAAGNSDHGYRYYFELDDKEPVIIENVEIDPERNSVTGQLLIVCEQECAPLGNSLWEVAGFGRAEIVGQWDVSVVKVYKLRHYEDAVAKQQ